MYFTVNGGVSGWINSWYVTTKVGTITKPGVCPDPNLKPSLNMMQLGEQVSIRPGSHSSQPIWLHSIQKWLETKMTRLNLKTKQLTFDFKSALFHALIYFFRTRLLKWPVGGFWRTMVFHSFSHAIYVPVQRSVNSVPSLSPSKACRENTTVQ